MDSLLAAGSRLCMTAEKQLRKKQKNQTGLQSAEREGTFHGHRFDWAFFCSPRIKKKKPIKGTSLYLAGSWRRGNVTTERISARMCFWDAHHHIQAHSSAANKQRLRLTNTNIEPVHIEMYTEYICTQFFSVQNQGFCCCATSSISTIRISPV